MTWQGVGVIVALVGLLLSLIGGGFGMCFFFGKFFAKFDALISSFTDFKKDFEDHMKEEARQIEHLWKKTDIHGEKLVEHHQRIINLEKTEG